MTIRKMERARVPSSTTAGSYIADIERRYGQRLRREAAETWKRADDQMIGDSWNGVLMNIACWIEDGKFVERHGNLSGWLWKMLRRRVKFEIAYAGIRSGSSCVGLREPEFWMYRALSRDSADHVTDRWAPAERMCGLLAERQSEVAISLAAGCHNSEVRELYSIDKRTLRRMLRSIGDRFVKAGFQPRSLPPRVLTGGLDHAQSRHALNNVQVA